jgi:hypothetical protein
MFIAQVGTLPIQLTVGRSDEPSDASPSNAFVGVASELVVPGVGASLEPGLQVRVGQSYQTVNGTGEAVGVTITGSHVTLVSGSHIWSSSLYPPLFQLGRLSVSSVALAFTITGWSLISSAPDSILPVFVVLSVVAPSVFTAIYFLERRREGPPAEP